MKNIKRLIIFTAAAAFAIVIYVVAGSVSKTVRLDFAEKVTLVYAGESFVITDGPLVKKMSGWCSGVAFDTKKPPEGDFEAVKLIFEGGDNTPLELCLAPDSKNYIRLGADGNYYYSAGKKNYDHIFGELKRFGVSRTE